MVWQSRLTCLILSKEGQDELAHHEKWVAKYNSPCLDDEKIETINVMDKLDSMNLSNF
ncbi:hypothetical protein GLYMA_05G082100v4 [Glycine max]|uniref:Uncharacterized protein n=1 Tax=Glycine max TaxID=3847 RepID=A0A0R0JY07_SOYBN|nr:hypothetical protein GYH30_012036 [Glycine max]KRH57753.1 hypothetical protein GLYMA_05G082100v4 [Glycine max]